MPAFILVIIALGFLYLIARILWAMARSKEGQR